jgi:hypothetical protein
MAVHIVFESDDWTTDLSGGVPQASATRETPVRAEPHLPEITDEPRSERYRIATWSLNRPERERLPCFNAGIAIIKKIQLTTVAGPGERYLFSES